MNRCETRLLCFSIGCLFIFLFHLQCLLFSSLGFWVLIVFTCTDDAHPCHVPQHVFNPYCFCVLSSPFFVMLLPHVQLSFMLIDSLKSETDILVTRCRQQPGAQCCQNSGGDCRLQHETSPARFFLPAGLPSGNISFLIKIAQ